MIGDRPILDPVNGLVDHETRQDSVLDHVLSADDARTHRCAVGNPAPRPNRLHQLISRGRTPLSPAQLCHMLVRSARLHGPRYLGDMSSLSNGMTLAHVAMVLSICVGHMKSWLHLQLASLRFDGHNGIAA
jgi:hypothetical protein